MATGTVEQLSVIRAALDPSGYQTGAQAIQRADAAIVQSQKQVASSSTTTTRAMEATERAFIKSARAADPVVKALLDLQREQEKANRAVMLGVATQQEAGAVILKFRQGVDAAVASKQRLAGAATQATNALGVTKNQMQQLAPQVNDVVTSLLGGASAFQVLTQQGGQITQAMGGVGNTFRTVAGLFTPMRVAIAGTTIAIAAAALAFEGAESRIGRLQASLRATRSDWQAFAGELDARMRTLAPSILTFTSTETQQVGQVFANILPTDFSTRIEEFTRVTAAWARMTGQEAVPAARELSGAYNNLGEFVRRAGERDIRGFNEEFRVHIERMVASGRTAEAYAEVMQRVAAVAGDVRDTVRGTEAAHLNLARAWDNIRLGATRFLEQAGGPLIRFFGDAEQGASRFEAALTFIGRAALGILNPLRAVRNVAEGIFGRSFNIPGTVGNATGSPASGAVPTAGTPASQQTLSSVALNNIPERHRPPDTGSALDAAYLRDRLAEALGLTPGQSSGIVSGLVAESGLRTGAVRPGGADYGLAQWVGPRRNALFGYADEQGAAAYDPETQINFLIREIQQNPRILDRIRGTSDPFQAGQYFHDFLSGGAQRFEPLRDWHAGASLRIARMAPTGGGSSTFGAAPAEATGAASAPGGATGAGSAQQRESDRLYREASGGRTAADALDRARIGALEADRNRVMSGAEGRELTTEETARVAGLTEQIERYTAAINNRESTDERGMRTSRDNLRVLQTEDDLRRSIAQRQTADAEAARAAGRAYGPADARESERQERARAAAEREDAIRQTNRQAQAESEIAQSTLSGARSLLEMEARQRAIVALRGQLVTGTAEWRTEIERLTQANLRLSLATAQGQIGRQLPQQEQQLALLRAENDAVGRNTEERTRNLAVLRETERLRGIHPDAPNTPQGRESIANALGIANEQLRGQRLNAVEGYGREMGSVLGKHIADGIKTGSLRGFKEIPGMLWDIMARGLITKPLEDWFASMARNLFNGGGSSGGGGGVLGSIGSFFGLGGGGGFDKSFSAVSFDSVGSAVLHDGGMAGAASAFRNVDPVIFREAPRYHTGRGPGGWTAPDEIAAILQRDEVVLTKRQQQSAAAAMRGGGRPVTVVQNITTPDVASFNRSQAQQAARVRRAFARTARSV